MSYQELISVDAATPSTFAGGIAEGTTVRTPCGLRRVETLRQGDLVVTRCKGLQPLRALLTRTITRHEYLKDPTSAPVRLQPRAIGPLMPQQDLIVAPDQKILIPGYRIAERADDAPALAEARELLGTEAVAIDKSNPQVTFLQLVFDDHVVFMANGLPVESFKPCKDTLAQLNKDLRKALKTVFPSSRNDNWSVPPIGYPSTSGFELVAAQY